MPIRFESYRAEHVPAVRAFNARIAKAVSPDLLFPEDPAPEWLPPGVHPDLYQEAFLALDGDVMRGGYFLKHQSFRVRGETRSVACYRLPLSEGVADRAYTSIALQLLRNALARQPLLFSLGMGSLDAPVAKLEKAAGWSQAVVPFAFRVLRGGRFLRNLSVLRASPARRMIADLAAWTGTGALAFAALRMARGPRVAAGVSIEPHLEPGDWLDDLWNRLKDRYALAAVRDRAAVSALYPAGDPRFLRWTISRGGTPVGWAVALDTEMRGHKQFGDLRVATIVDAWADPSDAETVLACVTRELERRGVDLILSNQLHQSWAEGLRRAGFLSGPSNFIFSASRQLSALLAPFDQHAGEAHINRGDGDGPIHL